MVIQDRSQGPDRCRGSLNCRQWHDQGSEVSTTGTGSQAPGSVSYNRCCCDPCHYIRPRPLVFTNPDWAHCTRCVPRMILLEFVPYDDASVCCHKFSVPMFHTTSLDSEFISIYSGSLFGVAVTVELGSLSPSGTGTGSGTGTSCAWRVTMTGAGSLDTTVEIDHNTVTSLSVPTVTLENILGPEGCLGYLTLLDNRRRKVPFGRKTSNLAWDGDIGTGTGTGTGTGDVEKFVTLDPPCGDCTQVCSRICATGYLHETSEYGYIVFAWFDECVSTGTGSTATQGCRGWEYTDPVTLAVSRFYLEEDGYGRATIRPELDTPETGGEIYDTIIVDTERRCSCQLKENFYATVIRDGFPTQIILTIRCGECTCWDYHCGGCRCVPETLCLIYWDGVTAYSDIQLTWDPVEFRWGSDADPIMLSLVADDVNKVCRIMPVVEGLDTEAALSEFPTYSCTKETASHQFDPSNEFISVSFEGPVDLLGMTGTGTTRRNIAFTANALRPECYRGRCTEATPCYANCGSHPAALVLQFRQWGEIGDFSAPYAGATCDLIEVDLVFYEQPILTGGGPDIEWHCGYVGFFEAAPCCVVKVELRMGVVTFSSISSWPAGCQQGWSATFPLTTETCEPYYAQSDVIQGGAQLTETCLNCTDATWRQQVTVVEA